MLNKKGNSNSLERMDLLARFREIFRDVQIVYLGGDREFIAIALGIAHPTTVRIRLSSFS